MNTCRHLAAAQITEESVDASADPDPGDQHLTVCCEVDAPDAPDELALQRHLSAAMQQLNVTAAGLNIILIDDPRMAAMHEQYSAIAGTTDVLTFDLRDNPGDWSSPVDGEIYVCLDEARRSATQRGHALADEVLLYALHGLLHLLGYDDHEEDDYQLMHDKEDEILQAIGVGRIFGE